LHGGLATNLGIRSVAAGRERQVSGRLVAMKPLSLVLLAVALLPGCCMLMPCHRGLWAYGTVTEAGTATPIVGASVSVFGTSFRTGAGGCLKLQLADARPFEFTVKNPGDKPAVSTAPTGYFRVSVELAPEGSERVSAISWTASKEQAFAAEPDCK
jgi:hypothetical protein